MDSLSEEAIVARVAASATVLDRFVPDWVGRIDLKMLDVGNSAHCPLGQIYGSYEIGDRAMKEFGVKRWEMEGFNSIWGGPDAIREYRMLTNAWCTLINERRGTPVPLKKAA